MAAFRLPHDLTFNRGAISDPGAFVEQTGVASWLFLVGDEFATMPEGMSYAQVQRSVQHHARVVSDPPRELTLELARQHVEALDGLPRPTLISCRTGPRASAVAYMYAGLRAGAEPEDVIAAAQADNAPFCDVDEYREWVGACIRTLRREGAKGATPAP